MSVILEDTDAGRISAAIMAERFRVGSSTIGRVLTLVLMTDEATQADALRAAVRASRAHPCRIISAIPRPGRGAPRLDASVSVGGVEGVGEVVELRARNTLAHHVESVVLPLLLPDTPVVVWWPGKAPAVPADDPVGALAQRRITDAASATRPGPTLLVRRDGYRSGDTDLAWTRLTHWRALLAAALDQPYEHIRSATVVGARANPSGPLLAAWLHHCLRVPVDVAASRGPGLTDVILSTARGEIRVHRPDGRVATITRPGASAREAALPRRGLDHLIAEELRRLDPDEVYGEVVGALTDDLVAPARVRKDPAAPTRRRATARPAGARTSAKRAGPGPRSTRTGGRRKEGGS